MIATILYAAFCLAAAFAALVLQHSRHSRAKACIYWAYSFLAFGMGWEIWDAVMWGAPAFPSTRWLTYPALAVALTGAAMKDLIALRRLAKGLLP